MKLTTIVIALAVTMATAMPIEEEQSQPQAPAYGSPAYGPPGYGPPSYSPPSYGPRPTSTKHHPKPTKSVQHKAWKRAIQTEAAVPVPDSQYGSPLEGSPGYGPPGYGPPAYGPPSYGPPSYGPPSYGPPSYGPSKPTHSVSHTKYNRHETRAEATASPEVEGAFFLPAENEVLTA